MRRARASALQLGLFDLAPVVSKPAPVVVETSDAAARRAARELATDLVLRAGAGTGKTHTLVEAITQLVAGGTRSGLRVPPGRILVLTFSERAAAELRERVRAKFLSLADGEPLFRDAVAALGSAPISTFHGFAAGLLRRHAAAAGVDPGFALLDENDASARLRAAAEDAILARLDEPAVRELVRELDFSRGVDAPARGLVEHVAALVVRLREEGRVPSDLDDMLDDASGAPAELARAAAATRSALADLIAALAGSTTAGIVRRHAVLLKERAAVESILDALDPAADPLAAPVWRRVEEAIKGSLGNEDRHSAQRRLRAAFLALRTAHVAHRAAPLGVAVVSLVSDALGRYQAGKRAAGQLDFADLLLEARALLARDPGVRADEQARWDAILVDELQDTNDVQDSLVEGVRGPETRLLAVGDPKQSIYEFRGADVSVFDRIATRVASGRLTPSGVEQRGAELALTDSRRARAPLTHFVNRLFARAMPGGPYPFEIAFDPRRDALVPRRGGAPGEVCAELLECADPDDEPAALARRIRALVDGGAARVYDSAETARPVRFGDIALLLRRFTHLDALLEALRRAGVPHHVINGRGFFAAQEVRDLAAFLALLDDPDDGLALTGVLRSPLCGLSDAALVTLADAGKAGRRPAALSLAPLLMPGFAPALPIGEAARLQAFLTLYGSLRRHADRLGAAGTVRAILDATDLCAIVATTFDGEQRVANLERLVGLARAHDDGHGDRRGFVRRLAAEAARERSLHAPAQILGEHDDVVCVMTVHQSKGLEFPVVFVPECGAVERDRAGAVVYDRGAGLGLRLRLDDGERVASPRAVAAEALLRARARAESARLFYVACTRARDLLVLSGEIGRGQQGAGTSWRKLLDEALAADDEARALCRVVAGDAPAPRLRVAQEPLVVSSDELARLARSLAAPATGARVLIAPVTELADLAQCPRRYHLRHELGLVEPPGHPTARAATAPGDASSRGSLAHLLLERLDLGDWRARGAAALADLAAEVAPANVEDVHEICTQVAAFLWSPFGKALVAAPASAVRRELPFALAAGAADGPRLLVKGQLDLVYVDPADGVPTIIDYKYARPAAGHDYDFQLLVYAAAVRAIFGVVPRVALVYLREAKPKPRFLTVDDATLDNCLAGLGELAAELANARQQNCFAGRELSRCKALRCGFVERCHPAA